MPWSSARVAAPRAATVILTLVTSFGGRPVRRGCAFQPAWTPTPTTPRPHHRQEDTRDTPHHPRAAAGQHCLAARKARYPDEDPSERWNRGFPQEEVNAFFPIDDRRPKKVVIDIDVLADTIAVEGELALALLRHVYPDGPWAAGTRLFAKAAENSFEAATNDISADDDDALSSSSSSVVRSEKTSTTEAPHAAIAGAFRRCATELRLARPSELVVLLKLLFDEANSASRGLTPGEIVANWHEVIEPRCLASWPAGLQTLDDLDRAVHDVEPTEEIPYRASIAGALRSAVSEGLVDAQILITVRADSVMTSHVSQPGWKRGTKALLAKPVLEKVTAKRDELDSVVRSGEPLFLTIESPPHLADLCRLTATSPEHHVSGVLYFGTAADSLAYAVASGWADSIREDPDMFPPRVHNRVRPYRCAWSTRWAGPPTSATATTGLAARQSSHSSMMASLAAAAAGSSLVAPQRKRNKRQGLIDVTDLESEYRDFRDALGLLP